MLTLGLLVEETVSWSNLLLMEEEEESKCGGGDGERGEQTHQSGTQHREVWQNVALHSSHQMLREKSHLYRNLKNFIEALSLSLLFPFDQSIIPHRALVDFCCICCLFNHWGARGCFQRGYMTARSIPSGANKHTKKDNADIHWSRSISECGPGVKVPQR